MNGYSVVPMGTTIDAGRIECPSLFSGVTEAAAVSVSHLHFAGGFQTVDVFVGEPNGQVISTVAVEIAGGADGGEQCPRFEAFEL